MMLKKHMIIKYTDDLNRTWTCVVFYISKKDIRNGINADHEGWYGFRGLWYKGNGTQIKSYGKIHDFIQYPYTIIRTNLFKLSKKQLKKLIN
jgi:hypothetical protein